jgi:hypothetical protein
MPERIDPERIRPELVEAAVLAHGWDEVGSEECCEWMAKALSAALAAFVTNEDAMRLFSYELSFTVSRVGEHDPDDVAAAFIAAVTEPER